MLFPPLLTRNTSSSSLTKSLKHFLHYHSGTFISGEDVGEGDILPTAAPSPASLRLPGLIAGCSNIVTHSTLARMELALPKHYRGYNWYLLFSTYR